jgi:hypothetical protein
MDIDFLRSAFAGDSVPEKNIALRKAHDEIERLRAGIAGARDSLERCFEPTVPLRVLPSELERAVKDAYLALRRTLSN